MTKNKYECWTKGKILNRMRTLMIVSEELGENEHKLEKKLKIKRVIR